jgi:hypothetical protein
MIFREIEASVGAANAKADREFEASLIGRSPIEQDAMRMIRKRLQESVQAESDANECVVLYGDGSAAPSSEIKGDI